MRRFVQLFRELNETNSTQAKIEAMVLSFQQAEPADAAWMLYFLTGKKLKPMVTSKQLRGWAADLANLPLWLVERSYETAGDLAETIALILPAPMPRSDSDSLNQPLHTLITEGLIPLRERSDATKHETLIDYWGRFDVDERFIFNKLITGGLRIGVSRTLVERAVARAFDIPEATITHRLMGNWEPSAEFWERLINPDVSALSATQPYAFFLAYPLESRSVPKSGKREVAIIDVLKDLGPVQDWQVEWKWDGIRAQIVRREGIVMLWSRGEERVHEMFPEISNAALSLPEGCVLDGEIVAWDGDRVGSFANLQHRIGRKNPTQNVQSQYPCVFVAYDILEYEGRDIREEPLSQRRSLLESVVRTLIQKIRANPSLKESPHQKQIDFFDTLDEGETGSPVDTFCCSEVLSFNDWESVHTSHLDARAKRVEGFMLKRRTAPYRNGRVKGDWWKWKTDPFTVDCVMLYAQAGHGRRAGLYTDFTFGVLHEGEFLPFTKAYSGLTNEEFRKVDAWIKKNTLAKKGPIRTVKPELVFEVAFENIHYSKRHRAGVALRFPRIARWRQDKLPEEIDTLENLMALANLNS